MAERRFTVGSVCMVGCLSRSSKEAMVESRLQVMGVLGSGIHCAETVMCKNDSVRKCSGGCKAKQSIRRQARE